MIELHDSYDGTAALEASLDYSQGPGYVLVQVTADSQDGAGVYLSSEQTLTLADTLIKAARELELTAR